MVILSIFVILFAAIVGLMVYKGRTAGAGYVSGGRSGKPWSEPMKPNHRPAVQRKDYRAVSIQCGKQACAAARRLEGKRGGPAQIPYVPLSQCDAESCECQYKHYADRRSPRERREEIVYMTGVDGSMADRRGSLGRRAEDCDDDPDTTDLEIFNIKN